MPNILFASNNTSHFPNSAAGSQPNSFDSNRVPYGIGLTNFEVVNSPVFTPSTGDETWFHFRMYTLRAGQYRSDELFAAYDDAGVKLFRLFKTFNSGLDMTCVLNDGNNSLTEQSSTNITLGKVNSIDIRYVAQPLGLTLDVYINSSLVSSQTFASNPNGYTAPVRFSIGTGFTEYDTSELTVSEIIVADGDTRNARLDLLRPTSAGAYEEWVGSLVALADDDPTSGMTAIAGGQRQTVRLTPYTGAPNISNFIVVSQTTRGQNSPTKLKHTVRLSGVDYDTADMDLDFTLQYNITDYNINPATSLPWEGSDLAAIETGFVSVT
jgi:hypothetical protein